MNKMKKKILSFIILAAILCNITGCQKSSADLEKKDSVDEAGNMENTEQQEAYYIFTDDVGREVKIPQNITGVVPAAALPQIVLLTIAPEKLVGLSSELYESSRGIIADECFEIPFFGSLYSGNELNVEELAMTHPQLIIDMGEAKKTSVEDLNALQEQTQIPAVYISATIETMPEAYRKLGKILGKEEKAEELAAYCEKIYNRTLDIMEKVGDEKVSCLFVTGEEGLNVIASTSYHAELVDLLTNNLAVVDNPLSKGTGNEVSMEQILLWNPEFVIFAPDSIYDSVKDKASWNQVDAIVNNNYVEVPDIPHNWMSMPPAVQRYLGLIWLPAELYPEYCDYDVKADIMEFYELFFGCRLTDEQYEMITENAFRE